MASVHKDLFICVVCNGTANSSDYLMTNVWLMSEKLMGVGNVMTVLFRFVTSLKVASSISNGVIGNFHSHNPSGRTMTMGRLSLWQK